LAFDVVVVTTHDIGRHLHCYGRASVVSPRLDAMAADGVMFEAAFASAPQCSPSRASLATGMYPHNNGVMGLAHRGFDWDLAVPHAAKLFSGHGFGAHLFGGQHVSPQTESLGFSKVHPPNAFDEVLAAQPRDQRLYLEVNFDETHRPYPELEHEPRDVSIPGYLPPGPEAAHEMAQVEATIQAVDTAAGRVFDALKRAGREHDAIVVFTTDHGLAMPRAKCTLYDAGIEVALLMRWPEGGMRGGEMRSGMVSNIDVLPTLLEACGLPIPPGVQGQSLARERDAIFAEKTFHSYYDPMRCVRTKTHKYIRNFEAAFLVEVPGDIQRGPIFRAHAELYSADRPSEVELYDLRDDPLEQRNLAGDAAVEGIERELDDRLWRWMKETDDPLVRGPVASPRYRRSMFQNSR
jgi:N-sulfoglucosamine sulfohydrolase